MINYRNRSLQFVFNKVARHLLKQGCKAKNSIGECVLYNEENETRCAYGCMISLKDYRNKKFFSKWSALHDSGILYNSDKDGLMMDLMNCHDKVTPSRWASRLRALAKKHKLEIPDFLKGA